SIQVSPESVLLRILPAQPTANLVSVLENQCPTSPDRRATLTNSFRRQWFLKWRLTHPPSRNQAAISFCGWFLPVIRPGSAESRIADRTAVATGDRCSRVNAES